MEFLTAMEEKARKVSRRTRFSSFGRAILISSVRREGIKWMMNRPDGRLPAVVSSGDPKNSKAEPRQRLVELPRRVARLAYQTASLSACSSSIAAGDNERML